jgi:hypothetical protein
MVTSLDGGGEDKPAFWPSGVHSGVQTAARTVESNESLGVMTTPPQRLQGEKRSVIPKATLWAAEISRHKRAQLHTARGDWRRLRNGELQQARERTVGEAPPAAPNSAPFQRPRSPAPTSTSR